MAEDAEMPNVPPAKVPRNFFAASDTGTAMSSMTCGEKKPGEEVQLLHLQDVKSDAAHLLQGNRRYEAPTKAFYPTGCTRAQPLAVGVHGEVSGLSWGYEAEIARTEQPDILISKPKLLLSELGNRDPTMIRLKTLCRRLKQNGVISHELDVLEDYMIQMLSQTMSQLKANYDFNPDFDNIEFCVSIPAAWSPTACRRMHQLVLKALKRAGFVSFEAKSVKDLYMVSESEAAAAYALKYFDQAAAVSRQISHWTLKSSRIKVNEAVVVINAGGGTTDIVTYVVTAKGPCRVQEIVPADGECVAVLFLSELNVYRPAFWISIPRRLSSRSTEQPHSK